jgi:hypothetical protein
MALREIGRYDGSLQMFVQAVRYPDLRWLRFMRWLVEHNHFGHPPVGPSSGELAAGADEEGEQPPVSS